jgi:hypothetical protein
VGDPTEDEQDVDRPLAHLLVGDQVKKVLPAED